MNRDDAMVVDFETRSDVDLNKCGVEVYAESPLTEAVCIAAAKGRGAARGALLLGGAPCPEPLAAHVRAGGILVAHNTPFELAIWAMLTARHGPDAWPPLRPEQCHCTMAMGRALALPASLEKMCEALKLPVEKDMRGRALMLQMCKPRKPRKHEPQDAIIWKDDAESLAALLTYCVADVAAEQALWYALPPLTDRERELWTVDRKINNRGVCLDLETVPLAIEATERAKGRLNAELCALTGRKVRTLSSAKAMGEWLAEQGAPLPDLRKDTVKAALARDLPPAARRALEIRQEGALASTAKLTAMLNGAGRDWRARGLHEYWGASTGRWAGRRIQTQNMVRPPEDFDAAAAEEVFAWLRADAETQDSVFEMFYGSTMRAVSNSLRSLVVAAPGSRLLSADYANIEGRALAWLAGEGWKLDAFRAYDAGDGADLYKIAFSKAFGVPVDAVTKEQRQIGKVQELALGYQGAHGAFVSMTKNYGIDLAKIAEAVRAAVSPGVWDDAIFQYWQGARETAEEMHAAARAEAALDDDQDATEREREVAALAADAARARRYDLSPEVWAAIRIIVDGWRGAHVATTHFWRALEDAAIDAVERPGHVTRAGRVAYRVAGDFLMCKLPSGRCLGYPYPAVSEIPSRSNRPQKKLTFWGVSSKTRKWQEQKAYGGLLAENVTQAAARDVLADALLRLDGAGYRVTMHVHDEIVAEMPNGQGYFEEFARLMSKLEPWAEGLPVVVDGWEGRRYRK